MATICVPPPKKNIYIYICILYAYIYKHYESESCTGPFVSLGNRSLCQLPCFLVARDEVETWLMQVVGSGLMSCVMDAVGARAPALS